MALGEQPRVPLSVETLAASRRSMVEATPAECGQGPPVGRVVDVDAGGVPGRLYEAAGGGTDGAGTVFAHGGGWVLGDLGTHDAVCRALAVHSGRAVLAVDYRRAPENPYPAAVDDLERAVDWLRGTGRDRVAVCGDSAGGHLAAVVARRARDRHLPLAGQVLVYPVIEPAQNYPDLGDVGLDPREMRFFWDAYAPPGMDRAHPDLDPSRAVLTGLPPTLVLTAEYDILCGEGERYAAALAEAGVRTTATRYLGMTHGFFRRLALIDAAGVAVVQVGTALRTMLDGPL